MFPKPSPCLLPLWARTLGSPHPPPAQARDAYYACLEETNAPKSRAARKLRSAYEKHCPQSWVAHFDKKREDETKLAALLATRDKANAAAA